MYSSSGRNNKLRFYFSGLVKELLPDAFFRFRLDGLLSQLERLEDKAFMDRLHHYNKLKPEAQLAASAPCLSQMKLPKRGRVYYLDARETARYFPPDFQASYLFGDNTISPEYPALTKSRPIRQDNQNAVLMKFNKVRHFAFVKDAIAFHQKADRLIGMAEVKQSNRRSFYTKYFGHPKMDLGQINTGSAHDQWYRPKISIPDHLRYKYILCLEGYDVASNLKWVMSSGSLAVMPPPSFETWFMEAKLIPDKHYVSIKPDFSDVEERMDYFSSHPEHAKEIIHHANTWVKQFQDIHYEFLLELAVMIKYFLCTGQDDRFRKVSGTLLSDLLHSRS